MSSLLFAVVWNAGIATALAVVVWLAARIRYFQSRPALMHALWLLVLVKLVAPPIVPLPVLAPGAGKDAHYAATSPAVGIAGPSVAGMDQSRAFETREAIVEQTAKPEAAGAFWPQLPWPAVLLGLSLCGTLVLIAWGSWQHARVVRLLRCAALANERVQFISRAAADRMGLRTKPKLCTVDAAVSPFLWPRLNGPMIVLPTSLVQQMSDEQLGCVVCHELAHWMRWDHWANLFALLVNGLFWWHPIAWWVRCELRATQETCCDSLALAEGGLPRRCYAETLLAALDFVQANQLLQPALASGFGGSSSLQRRFEMIASFSGGGSRLSRWWGIAAAAAVLAMLCVPTGAQPKGDAAGWTEIASLAHEHPVNIVTSNIDWVGVGEEGGNVFAWPAKTLEGRRLMARGAADGGSFHTVDRLQITPDGRDLYAVMDHYQMMWKFHLVNTRTDRSGAGAGGTHPHYFGFSFDTDTWIERHLDHTVLVLRKNSWGPNAEPGFKSIEYDAEVTQAMISENGEKLAATTADGKLHLYDAKTLAKLHTIELPKHRVMGLQLSRDGAKVAVVGEQGLAKIFGVASGNEIAALPAHEGDVLAVAFSPDGKTVATGGEDKTVRLWDAESGAAAGVLKAHQGAVRAVGYDPSGDRIYTGSADKTLKVWEKK